MGIRHKAVCMVCCFLTACGTQGIGKVVYTDIVAEINGIPIKVYEIEGKTAIVAEELQGCGFDVDYWEEGRILQIYDAPEEIGVTAKDIPEEQKKKAGSFAASVYPTDIVTELDGREIPSYNIGGKTLILMEDLEAYGDVVWYPEERKVCFTYVPEWRLEVADDLEGDTSAEIFGFTLELTRDDTGELVVGGENRQYVNDVFLEGGRKTIKFRISLYQRVIFETEAISQLLQKMLNEEGGEWVTDDVTFANAHMKIVINGEAVPILRVTSGMGNGHSDYYVTVDKEIRSVEEIESISVECGVK